MPATVKCEVSLPEIIEPFVLGVHTIDAQSGAVQVVQNKLTVRRDNVLIEDGYIIHIILSGPAGFSPSMNVFVGNHKINDEPLNPIFKNGHYEFLYIREA